MDITGIQFQQSNDIVVTASWPTIADGTGLLAEFYYKPNKYTDDEDPSVLVFESGLVPDPANPGQTISRFNIPAIDNEIPGMYWWRVDGLDINGKRRTAAHGPLMVEAT